ncbi:hypothetical protein Pfo_013964 [Paulownia fortunei]|nr:hypothetical protein Pfo_013964 [Paulownia fortunei]
MSAANTLNLQYDDILYMQKHKFTDLASISLPLHDNDEPDLRNLLNLVRMIMNQTKLSIFKSKAEAMPKTTTQRTDSGGRVSGAMLRDASSIAQQIALQDGENPTDRTWKILNAKPNTPLKTKAILALVAFASMYGKARLVAIVRNSNKLAKSITLLKQQPATQGDQNDLNIWFEALGRVIQLTLDVAERLMDLKEIQISSNKRENMIWTQLLLSTAVYRIVYAVVNCWSQVVTTLIKPSRKEIISNCGALYSWEFDLINKSQEIEEKSAKHPDEQPQALPLPDRPTSCICWQKLCGFLTLPTVQAERQTMHYTRTNSLPDRHLMFSNAKGAGALPRDKEAVERKAREIDQPSDNN